MGACQASGVVKQAIRRFPAPDFFYSAGWGTLLTILATPFKGNKSIEPLGFNP
jgi:hypothetical protein